MRLPCDDPYSRNWEPPREARGKIEIPAGVSVQLKLTQEAAHDLSPLAELPFDALDELDLPERAVPTRAWAKEAIFPDDRFPGAADRGPEMKSTGEVMAGGDSAHAAYARVIRAAGRGRAAGSIGPPLQELSR